MILIRITAVSKPPYCTLFISWNVHSKNSIYKSLCRLMDKGICNGDHLPANQPLSETALHPMEPAASQETWISGMGAQRGDNRNLYLLHDWKNSSHHDKSKWNPLLNLIGWSSLWKATSRLIVWRRRVRPEGTTLQACWRLPIKESSTFRVQWRFCDQETRSVWIRSNFSLRIEFYA